MENTRFEEIAKKICKNNAETEQLLLEALESDDMECAYDAKMKLIQIYGTGEFVVSGEGAVEIPGFPDMDKLKVFVANEIEDDTDVWNMVYALYYDFIYHNFGEMPDSASEAMETALTAVECSEEDDFEDNGKPIAKTILFWLYYNGEYESDNSYCNIHFPSLKDRRKAAELLRYETIMNLDLNPGFGELRGEGRLDELFEEAYNIYPKKEMIVRNLVERCAVAGNFDKLVEIIQNADESLASSIGMDLLDEWEYYFEDVEYSSEDIEKMLLVITDKGAYVEFLLSLYQFGSAKINNSLGEYEVVLPELKDEEKAKILASKNERVLLVEPIEIEV